jgi:hypothetical protein
VATWLDRNTVSQEVTTRDERTPNEKAALREKRGLPGWF